MNLEVVILAAGQGKRMKSAKSKVLHEIAGKPMLHHVIETAQRLNSQKTHIIYGHGGEQVRQSIDDPQIDWTEQTDQLGTGHAVKQVLPVLSEDSLVLILFGDVPMISHSTLENLIKEVNDQQMALLTIDMQDPTGYGRIIRNSDNNIIRIVEHGDATEQERAVTEINTGIMAVGGRQLKKWVSNIKNDNKQSEYYLTDIIEMAVNDQVTVKGVSTDDEVEVTGINDKIQLQKIERAHQLRQAEELMRNGVTLADANRIDIRGKLTAGQDVSIDINVICEGEVTIGDRSVIGPNVILRNVSIADDVTIHANSVLEDARVGSGSRIGPFARIRPETELSDNTHIGNFVEIKKTTVGQGSKINHLSYVGDSEIGSGVNIGAGTITCNYDGANKFKTVIGDNVFVGSDSQLVAPVTIGDGATIGAGSTITRDTPDNKLTLSRSKQISIDNWQRPVKTKK